MTSLLDQSLLRDKGEFVLKQEDSAPSMHKHSQGTGAKLAHHGRDRTMPPLSHQQLPGTVPL